jgi:LPXTG-site transpeptidase (sortase) family protein
MKVKSATGLFVAGFLVLAVSLALWVLGRPAQEAGDATALEQALSSTTNVPLQTAPTTTATAVPAADEPGPSVSIPQFTVGRHLEGHNRVPVALRIPAIDVAAPVNSSGVEANGDMDVPGNVTEVGWYKFGPAPGEPGSAVLAAHVDLARQGPGVFFNLRTLTPGDVVLVDFDDGTTESYRVQARTIYEKTELPIDTIFSRGGPPVLTLITCGGGFNRDVGSYDSNVVVYAVPDADTSPLE